MSTESSRNLIDELDALFGKAAAVPSKKKPGGKGKQNRPTAAAAPAPRDPRYWEPEAVVLYTSSWRCTCGNTGDCSPFLAVRERCGRALRHRSLGRRSQFAKLPREIERAEPIIIHDCPSCFGAGDEHLQLQLPFEAADVSELARFIESGLRAAEFAEAITDPWNTSRLTPEARELRLGIILNLQESFNHAE